MKVYRYRSISTFTYRELLTQKQWFSSFEYLNDPFEGIFIDESGAQGFRDFIDSLQLCCFSKTKESLLMWAHYADQHKGLCLEFDIEDSEYKSCYMDVIYSNKQPVLGALRTFPEDHKARGAMHLDVRVEGQTFRTKSNDWAYEEEVRTFAIRENPRSVGQLKEGGGKLSAIYFGIRADRQSINDINVILKNQDDVGFH